MTAAALLELIGGVRAAIFAAFAAALAVVALGQTWRLHAARTEAAELKASVSNYETVNSANLSAIEALNSRITQMVQERAAEQKRSAMAVANAMIQAQNAQALADKRQNELEEIYARNPAAAAWGAAGVDADVLRQLPGNQN